MAKIIGKAIGEQPDIKFDILMQDYYGYRYQGWVESVYVLEDGDKVIADVIALRNDDGSRIEKPVEIINNRVFEFEGL